MHLYRRATSVLTLLLLLLALVVAVPSSQAGPAWCEYDSTSKTVSLNHGRPRIRRMGDSIAYSTGAGYQACGIATVENTDRIRFVADSEDPRAWIDLSHGYFAPGATPEARGLSEIEISVANSQPTHLVYIRATDQSDPIVCSGSRTTLNNDADSDLTFVASVRSIGVESGPGDDTIDLARCDYNKNRGSFGLRGGLGDDTLIGGRSRSSMNGGKGRDVLSAKAGRASFLGGEGNDLITGTAARDSMSGEAGQDILLAGGGTDHLQGGEGDDVIKGGPGIDDMLGTSGNDRMRGQSGDDLLRAGPGDDDVLGGRGDDEIRGHPGDDNLEGSSGDDVIRGFKGDDHLDGDAGTDVCDGGPGHDTKEDCESSPS